MNTLFVRSERVLLPDGVRAATIAIEDGRIAAILEWDTDTAGVPVEDAGPLMVLPGLVDTHVHVDDPGRADWEGFEHATKAAAAGGVTTIVDMPLNSVPATTDVDALDAKRRAARGRCWVDVGCWGGVVPGNVAALEPLAAAGVLGFKCFLSPSGVDEFAHVEADDLRRALPVLAALHLPLLVHAELPALLHPIDEAATARDRRRYDVWLESRPPEAEQGAIDLLIGLSRASGAHVHIVHLASADALPRLVAARRSGVPITVETCPHYLTFAAEDIEDGATPFKCAPPIRDRRHRDDLWEGLDRGSIDLIASDHSPAPPALKHIDDGDFVAAWGGIASLQLSLRAVWTEAARRGHSMSDVIRWTATAPARLAGLEARKGAIAPGRDADLVIFDDEKTASVDPAALYHRHPVTPYAGMCLRGLVRQTFLRGEMVFCDGECVPVPRGRLLGDQ